MMMIKYKLNYGTRMTHQSFRSSMYVVVNAIIIILVLLLVSPVQVHGFASYLLSKSSCKQPLKVGDIMMNYPIKSYIDSSDPTMLIQPVGINNNSDNNIQQINTTTVLISPEVSLPVTIDIHVTSTSNPDETDYQYVIDVIDTYKQQQQQQQEHSPKAYFTKGSCSNNVRIAGIGTNIVSITIQQHGAQIVAGWASGYVSVKLTPILTFVTSPTLPIDYYTRNSKKLETNDNNHNKHDKSNNHQSEQEKEQEDEEIILRRYLMIYLVSFILFIVYLSNRCCFWNKNRKSKGDKV